MYGRGTREKATASIHFEKQSIVADQTPEFPEGGLAAWATVLGACVRISSSYIQHESSFCDAAASLSNFVVLGELSFHT